MIKRLCLCFLGCLSAILLLAACGSNSAELENAILSDVQKTGTQQENVTETETDGVAEGYELFGDRLWKVGGLFYKNQVIDIKDNDTLADLYDSTYLSFDPDGTFFYLNLFAKEGTYKPYAGDGKYDYYLLTTERTLKFDSEKGEFVENESGSNTTYIIAILDENTIEFVEFDAITGKAKAGEDSLIFVKSDAENPYMQNNKTDISQNNNAKESGNSSAESVQGQRQVRIDLSYQSILDEYTERMESAVVGLVREYKSETSGISDVKQLAEICNDKIEDLADILNEGIGEMADLMYSNGDSYNTYESWAGELMENYNDIAQEIMDTYLDSAMD